MSMTPSEFLYFPGVTEMKVAEAKAEAYKEFAERLKAKFAVAIIKNVSVEFALGYKTAFIDITNNIDNLLKEMVGDNNEN